jgi:hypothetical protein
LKEAFFENKRPLQVRQNNINNPSSTQFANDQTSVSTLKAEQNMSCIADIGITKGMQCNDTPTQRLRKRAFCLLLLAPIAFIFGSPVRAEFNIEPILQAYIASAFQKNTAVSKRFPDTQQLQFEITCLSPMQQSCDPVRKLVVSLLSSNANMQLSEGKLGSIRFYLAPRTDAMSLKSRFSNEHPEEVIDNQDSDCQLYMKVRNGEIQRSDLVISIHASSQKIASCVLLNLSRGMGLEFVNGASFNSAWNGVGQPLQKLTVKKFNELKQQFELLSYIHACPAIRPGMIKSEILSVLSSCTEKLRQINSEQ